MHGWIQECERNHPVCRLTAKPFKPTRLIDVGTQDAPEVKLETEGIPGLRYVALSHCWGPPDPERPILKTESSTITEREKGIPLNIMPKNFRDAILVTRRLGLQYLWIDSLCIIQDSVEDWRREAAMMDQVYIHAYVTLAATSTSTSHDGFLERPLKEEVRVPFVSQKDGSVHGHIYLRQVMDNRPCKYETNVECSKWNDRGWTLQERFLSRRLVHFCRDQSYFECRSAIWAEDNHKIQHLPTPTSIADQAGSQNGAETENKWDDKHGYNDKIERIFEHWFHIVAQFSARQLTYGADKLPALSGLAKETSSAGPVGRYLAGIWEEDLAYGLLWICCANDHEFSSAPSYRAPSWSWASMDGQITWGSQWERNALPQTFELLQADIKLAGNDPFGSITCAHLVVAGLLLPVNINGFAQTKLSIFDFPYQLIHEGKKIGFSHLDLRRPEYVARSLFALQLFEQWPRLPEHGQQHVWCGLILEPSLGPAKTFRRVGLFFLDEEHLDVFQSVESSRITLV
ncbi:heterokaryon incompatibility protein-domain-containing protein [Macrophomina phaseolina]|uniref:Heterokaryon incompatibility protein-domain-containing protein n=1 Tax=Macrophomina phaseolina TaxID=35725 RepID=A0ABQ8FPX8_9PEZI|nr:heterokaryon incompatibility protein-domain-containing protein [Macrophomina phaseolina]